MKKTLMSVLAFAAVTASSNAFVVATSNLITPDATGASPVYNSVGAIIPLNGGSVAVGYFSTIADANLKSTVFTTLKTDFQQLGAAAPFTNGFSVDGFFDASVGAPIALGSSFIGKNVYVFIGNAATIAGSSDIAVWKGDLLFTADETSGAGSVTLAQADFGTRLLVGSDGGVKNTLDINFAKSISLANAPVPEPSAALLGAIGALGLLRRRRN